MKTTGNKIMALFSAVITVGAFIWDISFGIFTLFVCLSFFFIHYTTEKRRNERIEDLSDEIDKILHSNDLLMLDEFHEGELGILESEISKLFVKLREQSNRLNEDKIYLANSLADISHQIKTPLTSINLIVSLLSKGNIPEEEQKKLFTELKNLLFRIDGLISALLKISKLDAGTIEFKKERLPFELLIQKSVSPLLIPIELREQRLTVNTEGEFYGDLSWTSEALGNIIKNCMEHTPSGGTIKVFAKQNPLFGEIIIEDNGTGIDPDDLPHIFERFYRGKNSDANSFGIGLSLARMIIKEQNGTIKAEGLLKGGTRFTIRFYYQ